MLQVGKYSASDRPSTRFLETRSISDRRLMSGLGRINVTDFELEGESMTRAVLGKIHGKTIELEEDLGLLEGQAVEAQLKIVRATKRLLVPPPGWRPCGIETAAGMRTEH